MDLLDHGVGPNNGTENAKETAILALFISKSSAIIQTLIEHKTNNRPSKYL